MKSKEAMRNEFQTNPYDVETQLTPTSRMIPNGSKQTPWGIEIGGEALSLAYLSSRRPPCDIETARWRDKTSQWTIPDEPLVVLKQNQFHYNKHGW